MVATEEEVIIVGAGPSGLAAAACLSLRGVDALVLDRDDCVGSLWRRRTYARLRLNLSKRHSALPHAPHRSGAPTFLPRDDFVRYLDSYAARFRLRARLRREVRAARFVPARGRWAVQAVDLDTGEVEEYAARFLVAAGGAYDEAVVPELPGLDAFPGKVMHSSEYRSPEALVGKAVLVVGCGNSGMEIAYDLAQAGATTSIVVRSEIHLVTREIWFIVMPLVKYLPVWVIDKLMLLVCSLVFGDTSAHGFRRPAMGPLSMKLETSANNPVMDVGAYGKIKRGEIQVRPAVTSISGNCVEFVDGKRCPFDAIVFATGYKSTTKRWLESDHDGLIGEDGLAARRYPEHWKGENGLYCTGLARRGIPGTCVEAELIAEDISKMYHDNHRCSDHEQSNGI